MLSIFNQPTPLYANQKKYILRYFLAGCFVAFFLIFFQPFGTNSANFPYKNLFLSGYGWITFLALVISFHLLPLLFKSFFKEEKWVLWKQMVLAIFAISLSFIGCYFYMQLWLHRPPTLKGFFYFYRMVLPIALFPVLIFYLLDYIYQLKKNQQFAQNLNQHITPKTTVTTTIHFKDENGKADFSLPLDQLFFIKAANNYVEINYLEADKMRKHLLRNSIKNIDQQLDFPTVKRCHRSYLVNMDKVGKITGNAQGYKIHFPFSAEFVVPVSRSKGKELLAILKAT